MLRFPICTLFALAAAAMTPVRADVKLPTVLSSQMVIQRDQPVRVWGWAEANEAITVTLGDASRETVADAAGKWLVELPPQAADGQARQIKVVGKNEIVLEDVLVGEVWIGSGQSNMEWPLAATQGAAEAIAAADQPLIRLYHVPKAQADQPVEDINARWTKCTPETVPGFSAVLYHFGQQLQSKLNVPVGLINSSWGGSPIEPWITHEGSSGGMYNAMIAPLTNFAVRGSLWYQGETNVMHKNGLLYADKMRDLIEGWRGEFRNPAMAFYFVQIAPWSGGYEPGQLPALWEAQVATLKLPHTGMAVTTDLVDNIDDIHPQNKFDVGYRLSLWALKKVYGHPIDIYSGPLFKTMETEGDKIRLHFAHTGDGLKSRDGQSLTEFQIAGESGEFVPAFADVDGDTVVVHAAGVTAPKQVRFGWHKLARPNLVNSAGLPASPFQTQDWHGGTGLEE